MEGIQETRQTETLYLPTTVRGVEILVDKGEGMWLVDNSVLQSQAVSVGYRQSKQLDDRAVSSLMARSGAVFGTLIKGIDDGDGWFQTQVQKDQANIMFVYFAHRQRIKTCLEYYLYK